MNLLSCMLKHIAVIPLFLALIAAAAPTGAPTTSPAAPDPTAQHYRQIFARIDTMNEAERGQIGLCGSDGCWVVTTPLDASVKTMLAEQTGTLRLIRAAAAMPPPHW